MRKLYLLFIFFILVSGFSLQAQQVIFEDGFEDGNFSAGPAWSGDTGDFILSNASPNYLLQLSGDRNNGGISYLSTPSTGVTGVWEFYISLGFSPSEGNRTEIFLMSDIENLEGPVNGYALKAGESGSSDVFRIVRYDKGSEAATVLSGVTNIGSGGAYRIKISRESGGDWSLGVGNGYDGQTLPEGGIQNDNTYSNSNYFGLKATYTSSRFDKFFFDFKIDLPPFKVSRVTPSGSQMDVIFNRAYDPATVQTSDFSVSRGPDNPVSFRFLTAISVRLQFSDVFQSGAYTLEIDNLNAMDGSGIASNFSFPFIVRGSFTIGDIILNEFMYDPPAGLPEYVELRNISEKYLDLNDWKLGDQNGVGTIATDTLILQAGDMLVLSPDTLALFNRFGHQNYVQLTSVNFPSLNNGGDAIHVWTKNSVLVDSLFYTPEWGGEDIALERRSSLASSVKKANWGNAPQGAGTPGSPNRVAPDQTPPAFRELQIQNNTTLHLLFSEEIDAQSTLDPASFSVIPDRDIQLVSARNDTITLFLSQPMHSGQPYRVTVRNLGDIFGNILDTDFREATWFEFSEPQPGDLIINEILYKREHAESPEFVELYNNTDKNFDLSGWQLGDAKSVVTIKEGTTVRGREYLVLTDNPSMANGLYLSGFPSLNDDGDAIYIRNGEGLTIDSLFYTSTSGWDNGNGGTSLERKDPTSASNDPSNWQISTSAYGSTPGGQNSVFLHDTTPPCVVFAKVLAGGNIEVRFNEFIKRSPDLQFSLGKQALSVVSFDPLNAHKIILRASSAKPGNLTVYNISDVKGNETPIAEIPIAQKLNPADVVINEIMYNPLNNADDSLPNQSEYIELRNTRDYAVSLEGITLHDAPDEDGKIRSLPPVSTASAWIPARGLILIHADEAEEFSQSRTARFFDLSGSAAGDVASMRIAASSLSLASSADAIFLTDSTGLTMDSVFYEESWHNPNLIDTRGIALERINPSGPSSEKSNWGSSTTFMGGTPGSENSIYQTPAGKLRQTGMSFTPNPFSPDGDGYEDNLLINYKLDESDYMLKVRIYDRYGRLVRKLADGKPAGFEGSLMWDGRKDNTTGNRIGIYIVVFEAFNSMKGKDQAFKKTVVLARKL